MSRGDGPPPIFEGDDFPYWKIRMEAYLEALDVGILRAASQGFPKHWDATNLQGDEVNYKNNHENYMQLRCCRYGCRMKGSRCPRGGLNWANSNFLYNN